MAKGRNEAAKVRKQLRLWGTTSKNTSSPCFVFFLFVVVCVRKWAVVFFWLKEKTARKRCKWEEKRGRETDKKKKESNRWFSKNNVKSKREEKNGTPLNSASLEKYTHTHRKKKKKKNNHRNHANRIRLFFSLLFLFSMRSGNVHTQVHSSSGKPQLSPQF